MSGVPNHEKLTMSVKKKIGSIVSGSIIEGLTMRLDAETPLEDIKAGKFLSIHGKQYTFFCLITDLSLHATHSDIIQFPPSENETLLIDTLKKHNMYALVAMRPMLMLDTKLNRMPPKTVPEHFAPVYEATKQDVAAIFGEEGADGRFFSVGSPLDMEVPVCLDLDRLVERSNGIFGRTGTGKTFLTRLLLAAIVKSDRAVNLVFDMHSEYGLQARKEGNQESFVKGLKTLFPSKVAIFSLDPDSTRRRGGQPDVEVRLTYNDIRVEDIMPLQDELNLHPTALEAAYLISSKYKNRWLSVLLSQGETIKEFAEEIGAHAESVGALYRKLRRIERFSFLVPHSNEEPVIDRLLDYLDKGIHVILEFGNNTSMLCYLLISNIITRRIHDVYIQKTEKFLASHRKEDEPKKLMITIEEAHKFLNPQAAKQTIFGVIAREMRKYYVMLLVVDQRPSSIDQEVISQIGTKLVALLSDEKDINAVLTGTSNASQLRSILATLDTKKQALVMGHAVPMPVVIRTREYGYDFYQAMGAGVAVTDIKKTISEIF